MLNGFGRLVSDLRRDERGATLVEYAIALLLAIAVGGFLITNLAGNTQTSFCDADDVLTGDLPDGDC